MIAAIIVAICKCRQTYFGGTLTWCRILAKYPLHISSLRHYWPPPASMLSRSFEAVCDASRCVSGDEASDRSNHQSRWKPFTTLIGAFYWLDTHVVMFIRPQDVDVSLFAHLNGMQLDMRPPRTAVRNTPIRACRLDWNAEASWKSSKSRSKAADSATPMQRVSSGPRQHSHRSRRRRRCDAAWR